MAASITEDGYAHCRDLVRQADMDRFLSVLFAPADRRHHLYALYAFNIEIARVREVVSDALPGEVRLQWWCEALAGCGHGEVGRHPVAAALIDTLERFSLPAEPLIDLVEARTFDLYDDPMATLVDLEAYARSTTSVPMGIAAAILARPEDNIAQNASRDGGVAYALTGLMRAIPFHAARGKLFLPEEVLARHGVPPHDVLAGRSSDALKSALAELRALVRHRLRVATRAAAELPPAAVPAFLPLALVRPYLRRMEQADYNPFAECTIPQWRRQWLLWRAARNPARLN